MTNQSHKNLIRIGHIEGVSYLLLLLIAMPLKYAFGIPEGVRYIGMAHGVLFVWFMLLIALAFFNKSITFKIAFVLVVISFVPFGTFYIERILNKSKKSA
jgi:integral membrane protein